MSDDGADLGYTADQGLKGSLGGEQPAPDQRMTPERMREYLLSEDEDPNGYNEAGRQAGKIFYNHYLQFPEHLNLQAESEVDYGPNFLGPRKIITEGLDDAMMRTDPNASEKLELLDLSIFLYGWGINAARFALDKPSIPNPAILTFHP